MTVYYNEWDPYAAAWLRNLIVEGLIPYGHVDTRSIVDVDPRDLAGYTQCHCFAGLGGWALAGRLAGLPDDFPWWSGSCPCQPFSVAGRGEGQADERHLWPAFARLIGECRPPVVVGEQVAAAVGKGWLDGVCIDLEGLGYAVGAAVLPACAVGAPHRRDRLWFVADADSSSSGQVDPHAGGRTGGDSARPIAGLGGTRDGTVADTHGDRWQQAGRDPADGASQDRIWPANGLGHDSASAADDAVWRWGLRAGEVASARPEGANRGYGGGCSPMGDTDGPRPPFGDGEPKDARPECEAAIGAAWRGAVWLRGADGKARRVEPGICLLAHGVSARVGALKAYGNAIVPQVAAEFISAYAESRGMSFGA